MDKLEEVFYRQFTVQRCAKVNFVIVILKWNQNFNKLKPNTNSHTIDNERSKKYLYLISRIEVEAGSTPGE
ncbi:hypothetical protein SporoS204_06435 [Sporosarcina ureae]|uniref:Uncharacterized protein n=1 Tax=Sporosarcina ureae TaxID=1571 RepID=A0ABN4YPN2_SPOUR|nr:hypothetical protein SporoS204_06435 [Sporosarcina ureae]